MLATFKKLVDSPENSDTTESILNLEAACLCDVLADLAKKGPVRIPGRLAPAINNILMNFTMGTGSK